MEPYEDAAVLAPAYQPLADALGKSLGCQVELNITTNYTSEIEAMRNDKLDIAEFGPLAYVFAQKLANAELVATFSDSSGQPATYTARIVTWPGSGVTDVNDIELSPRTVADQRFRGYELFGRGPGAATRSPIPTRRRLPVTCIRRSV